MKTIDGKRNRVACAPRNWLKTREMFYIGVNHPAIVREIPHFDVFPAFPHSRIPAFPHFSDNVPHFWLYFEKQIFLIIVIILGARKKLCA